ncbi:hypothetical protein H6F96_02845 [Microcoleus sp. FACHB-53]|nr:hypothetical protein [Microcoleus sp. FACHB-53]
MTTATRPNNLETLEHLLHEGFQSDLLPFVPVQVQCRLKDEMLVVLAQHPATTVPDSQQVFSSIERTIQEQQWSDSHSVKIYLRVEGQKSPYAFYSFKIDRPVSPTTTTTPVEETLDTPDLSDSLPEEATDSHEVETETSQSSEVPPFESTSPHPWDQPIQEENSLLEEPPEEIVTPGNSKSKKTLLPMVVAGTGLSLFIFLTSLFLLTRPCVVGQCQALSDAQELSQTSLNRLQKPLSGKEVLEAQEQLMEAIRMLQSIPFWSGSYGKAQEQLKVYQAQAKRVEEMVTALQTAARAAHKSENPPHPTARWVEIQGLWREAIARLEELPTNSDLQPLAQQKIKEYKQNLAAANQRLVKERNSQQRLQEAKDAALIAEARQGVAQSLENWQLVYGTWQTAMKRLKQIPQGTTAYEQAQQLSSLYLPKMSSVQDKKTQEQFAVNAYNQGLQLAQLAKNAQLDNQWSVAVVHWRKALTNMNQVPKESFYYSKTQSLVQSYSNALKQAKLKLQLALKVQQTRNDLKQTCTGKVQVCNFGIINNIIKVRLTPAYTKLVKQTANSAQVRGDSNAQSSIVNHILTLGEALEAISDNARMRLEVYDADGTLIQNHVPGN